jgi:P-type Ca2+ transporter type 2C
LILGTGTKIAADARVIESSELVADEALLTGESQGVKKFAEIPQNGDEKSTMVYRGSFIQSGKGKAVVTEIGMNTEIGKINKMINDVEEEDSPLQERLEKVGKILGFSAIGISIVILVVGILTERGSDPNSTQPIWLQMLLIAVSLVVAAVPEGMSVCVTITLSMGMNIMAKKNSIVKNLKSVETLGSASVICSDKTGTLTKGEMTAVSLFTSGNAYEITGLGYAPEGKIEAKDAGGNIFKSLLICKVCNDSSLTFNPVSKKWEATGNLTDRALLVASKKDQAVSDFADYTKQHDNPFDSTRKMMSVVVELKDNSLFGAQAVMFVKGAPQYIFEKCTSYDNDGKVAEFDQQVKDQMNKRVDAYCAKAYRVIALAYKAAGQDNKDESNLTLIGLIACMDPPREGVAESIAKARNAGIRIVMITGDYLKTAEAIGREIGLLERNDGDDKVIDCGTLRAMQPAEQEKTILRVKIFARAKPDDKITIVKVFKKHGHVCAMTGDGVNDSPALKQADIGIAMGSGTDVAKAAAVMILTDDSFSSIVLAVEEGRRIYANIRKFVYYLLSTNIAEVFLVLIVSLMGLQSPLTAIQLLWMNVMTDSFTSLALACEEIEPDVMRVPPQLRSANLINPIMSAGIIVHSFILTCTTIGTYIMGLYMHTNNWNGSGASDDQIRIAQTMTIYVVVFAELMRAYTSRSLRRSVFTQGVGRNKWMNYAVISCAILTVAIGNIPKLMDIINMVYLDLYSWLWVVGLSIFPAFMEELVKLFYRTCNCFTVKKSQETIVATTIPAKISANEAKEPEPIVAIELTEPEAHAIDVVFHT